MNKESHLPAIRQKVIEKSVIITGTHMPTNTAVGVRIRCILVPPDCGFLERYWEEPGKCTVDENKKDTFCSQALV